MFRGWIRAATMTILVGLLLCMPMAQVASQQPGDDLSRARIVNSLGATLVASGETIILDPEKAIFLSESKASLIFVPLHHSYSLRAQELVVAMAEGHEVSVPVGSLIVVEPIKVMKGLYGESPEFSLNRGQYLLRWAKDKVVVVDQDGDVRGAITAELKFPIRQTTPVMHTDQAGEFLLVQISTPWIGPILEGGNRASAYSVSAGSLPDIALAEAYGDRAWVAGFVAGVILAIAVVVLF